MADHPCYVKYLCVCRHVFFACPHISNGYFSKGNKSLGTFHCETLHSQEDSALKKWGSWGLPWHMAHPSESCVAYTRLILWGVRGKAEASHHLLSSLLSWVSPTANSTLHVVIKGQPMPLKYSHSNLYLAMSWHSISCSCFCDCLTNHEFQVPGPLTEVARMHEKKAWLVIWKYLVKCRLPRGCIFSHSSHSFLYWKTVLPGKFPWRFLTFLLYKSLIFLLLSDLCHI